MHHVPGKGIEVDISYDVAVTYDQHAVQVIVESLSDESLIWLKSGDGKETGQP